MNSSRVASVPNASCGDGARLGLRAREETRELRLALPGALHVAAHHLEVVFVARQALPVELRSDDSVLRGVVQASGVGEGPKPE